MIENDALIVDRVVDAGGAWPSQAETTRMRRHSQVRFVYNGKEYSSWAYRVDERWVVDSIMVHFEGRDRHGFKSRRSRYLFRGFGPATKLVRTLMLIAASKFAERDEAEAV